MSEHDFQSVESTAIMEIRVFGGFGVFWFFFWKRLDQEAERLFLSFAENPQRRGL